MGNSRFYYTVYLKNFRANYPKPDLTLNEVLFFTVPSQTNEGFPVIDPVVSTEMGKSGSMEFSIEPGMKAYNYFMQFHTIIRVEYAGRPLFRGRVLTIDTDNITGTRKIHFEGDLSFLLDTVFEGKEKTKQDEESIFDYLCALLDNHNKQTFDHDRMISLGEVPGKYSNFTMADQRVDDVPDDKFRPTSWTQTMSCLSTLTSNYGGFMTTRYVNGECWLDWLRTSYTEKPHNQPIKLAQNVLTASQTSDVNNLFTCIIPVGRKNDSSKTSYYLSENKFLPVDTVPKHFSDAELNLNFHSKEAYLSAIADYGYIYKVVDFPNNSETEEKLLKQALNWIRANYFGGVDSFDICALDQYVLDMNSDPYFTGDIVELQFEPAFTDGAKAVAPDPNSRLNMASRHLVVKSSKYYLFEPEKNTYQVGIPDDLLTQRTDSSSSTSSTKTSSASTPSTNTDPEEWQNTLIDTLFGDQNAFACKMLKFLMKNGTIPIPDINNMESAQVLLDKISELNESLGLGLKLDGLSGDMILTIVNEVLPSDDGGSTGGGENSGNGDEVEHRSVRKAGAKAGDGYYFRIRGDNGYIESKQFEGISEDIWKINRDIVLINAEVDDVEQDIIEKTEMTMTKINSNFNLVNSSLGSILGIDMDNPEYDDIVDWLNEHPDLTITAIDSDMLLRHTSLKQLFGGDYTNNEYLNSFLASGKTLSAIHDDIITVNGIVSDTDLAAAAEAGIKITTMNSNVNITNGNIETLLGVDVTDPNWTNVSDWLKEHKDVTLSGNYAQIQLSNTNLKTLFDFDYTNSEELNSFLDSGLKLKAMSADVITVNAVVTETELKAARENGWTISKNDSKINLTNANLGTALGVTLSSGEELSTWLANNPDKTVWYIGTDLVAFRGEVDAYKISVQDLLAEKATINYVNGQISTIKTNYSNLVNTTKLVAGSIYLTSHDSGTGHDTQTQITSAGITAIQVIKDDSDTTGNTYKLQYQNYAGGTYWWDVATNGTFSRAITSYTEAWSGGGTSAETTLTVTPKPQNTPTFTRRIDAGVTWGWDGTNKKITVDYYTYSRTSANATRQQRTHAQSTQAVSTSKSWGSGNNSNVATIATKCMNITIGSGTVTVTAGAACSYNSSTKKFTATGYAYGDGGQKATDTASSEALSLADSWSGATWTVTGKFGSANLGLSKSTTVSAGASLSYDSSSHKFTANATAYAGGSARATASAGGEALSLSDSWSGGTWTVTGKFGNANLGLSKSTTVTAGASLSWSSSEHKYTATATAYAGGSSRATASAGGDEIVLDTSSSSDHITGNINIKAGNVTLRTYSPYKFANKLASDGNQIDHRWWNAWLYTDTNGNTPYHKVQTNGSSTGLYFPLQYKEVNVGSGWTKINADNGYWGLYEVWVYVEESSGESYSHSKTIYRQFVYTDSYGPQYKGKLYYKDANGIAQPCVNSDKYWYYCDSELGSASSYSVHYN